MAGNRIKQLLLLVILICLVPGAMAQINHLDKKVTLNLDHVKLKNALPKIGESGGFELAYNSEIIPGDSLVSVHAANLPVKELLSNLLGPDIRYKVLGNHVILLSDATVRPVAREERKKEYLISGYIYDALTGEILSSASVYEVEGMLVSATNNEGYYSLVVPGDRERQVLSYSKAGYLDTLIVVTPREQTSLSVSLRPAIREAEGYTLPLPSAPDVNQRKLVMALVPPRTRITADNIQVIEKRVAQVSFLPFIGSNRFVTGLITNGLSLNLLAGYSGGLRGVEMGGFMNIIRGEMHGLQMAGFGNIVGRNSRGAQFSGFFNVNTGSFTGLQATGFSNVVTDTIRGVQLAGFSNVLRGPIYGAQLSGFSNFSSHNMDGIQASGFANTAIKDVKVAQLSGFANYCRNLDGLQAAGFVNIASGECRGFQAAGFLNYATDLHGVQVSVFNIADTVSSGLPIGVLNIVLKGYHVLEISANELIPLNLTLKTGVPYFYNILTAGIQSEFLSVGYGLGSQFRLAGKLALSFDLTANYLSAPDLVIKPRGALLKLAPTLDVTLARHLRLCFGPTVNLFTALDPDLSDAGSLPLLFSSPVYHQVVEPVTLQAWIGATMAVRF